MLKYLLGADLRSLAALRVGAAFILLLDLIQRASDLEVFLTDYGTVPRALVIENLTSRFLVSFHLASGTWQIQALLLLVAAFFAVLLLIGYRTRLATVVSWMFLVSLIHRNPYVAQGGDMVLRLVLFWAIFLPWGARFSVDNMESRGETTSQSNHIFSAGTVAYSAQILVMYWFSVIAKSGREWWSEGSAVYYALTIDYLVTPIGDLVSRLPFFFLQLATWSVLGFEVIGPLLLFSPWRHAQVRTLGAFGFIALHCVFLSTMFIGMFPLVGIVSALFFLPGWFWDKLLTNVAKSRLPLKTYYDAGYRACSKVLRSGKELLPPPALHHRIALSPVVSVFVAFLLIYMLVWNLAILPGTGIKLSERFRALGNITGLYQSWELFAPFPAKDDGWYVIPATLRNGRRVDLIRDGAEIDWQKPKSIALTIKNNRWRKFLETLRRQRFLVPSYASYLCREWNRHHPANEEIISLDIVYMLEWTELKNRYVEPKPMRLLRHHCNADSEINGKGSPTVMDEPQS